MKFFVKLLMFFLLLAQAWLQQCPVKVSCDGRSFIVIIGKDFLGNGVILQPYQIVLGANCQVTHDNLDTFYLAYSVQECGIEYEVLWGMHLYHSLLKIFSIAYFYGGSVMIPVSCCIRKTSKIVQVPYSPVLKEESEKASKVQEPESFTYMAQQFGPGKLEKRPKKTKNRSFQERKSISAPYLDFDYRSLHQSYKNTVCSSAAPGML